MQNIVTLTMNPVIDKSAAIEHVVSEQKLRCDPPRHDPGGGGINISRAIQRLGGKSQALYPSGGPTGKIMQKLLDQENINHYPIPIKNWTRENFIVLEKASGQQYRFGMPGPALDEAEWRRCLDELANLPTKPHYIIASGSLPREVPNDFYARVARLVRDMGGRFIVDTSKEALCLAAREGVYLLKPNMRELRQLSEQEIDSEAEQEAAAHELVTSGQAEVVIVSLGAAGVLMTTSESTERFRAPTVKIKSKIGAGDSMVAGIVLYLAREKSLREAVRYGVAAGAAAVTTPGTELCRREDTERLYERIVSETG